MKKQHGLHVNAEIRKKCICDRKLYTENGKAEFDSPFSARVAAYNILKEKNISVPASELFIMSVLETAILSLAEKYVTGNRDYFTKVTETVSENFPIEKIWLLYLREFPSTDVFDGKETPEDYVKNTANFISLYLGIIQLWTMSKNPAYENMKVVFENSLSENPLFAGFADFGENQASLSPIDTQLDINLYNIFTYAYRKHPKNVADQLRCLIERFPYLSEEYGDIVSLALDLYTEETKPVFFGPGEAEVPDYEDDIFLMGEEKYTQDENWMPNAVILAKNALVWLSQLSEKYNREIKTLDEIPDEELDYIVSCGINALWLIGIWDRSRASKQIKQWTGNPEAESSAYSLRSYSVSEELGGYDAFVKFRNRAKSRNIRLAADMVPNHTAIDSYFLGEHPDWYIQLDYCPFPNYSFTGVSLSGSEDYGVFLEDHYFDRTDASVVFKYEDYRTGKVRYIYHGNDGTNMPWNDTAQLDYLKREVREAVKNIILQVAEDFSIIRFDAAMTLTKKHFQRLWYPEPGRGGDIPTRSAHGLSKQDFDEFFPQEFWREVVDMINEKKPDTLLLAEAFWLLEGYFVRSLGMHRVYNSAFMNMLRDEENAKYRDAIRMTLLFDRNILKRYVNFMSNPDEKTAYEQFGGGDKYFGICSFMACLPGLPMFAHGQFEGFKEKYGMEYKKAYWNEKPDEYLFERHKREIFPLLKMRPIFSGIENFRMYDFVTEQGTDENVFAITNKNKKNIGFYIYNNAYRETQGYVRNSVPFKDKSGGGEICDDIFRVFGLKNTPDSYLIYRDRTRELDYIVSAKEIYEKGLWFNLKAYEYHLFTDFRAVKDDEWGHYGKLWSSLKGEGVPDIKEAYENVSLGPLHSRLKKILDKDNFDMLWELYESKEKDDVKIYYFFQKVADSLKTAKDYAGGYENKKDITDKIYKDFIFILKTDWSRHINKNVISEKGAVYYLCLWMLLRHFGEMKYGIDDPVLSALLINEWKLKDYILDILPKDEFICTPEGVLECLVQIIRTQNWTDPLFSGDKTVAETLRDYLLLDSTGKVIKVNRFNNIMWFNKECIMSLTEFMRISFFVHTETVRDSKKRVYVRKVAERLAGSVYRMCEKSEYKFDNLLRMLRE